VVSQERAIPGLRSPLADRRIDHIRVTWKADPEMTNSVVAIVAILVSGVVGPGFSAWWARRRQQDDNKQRIREELQGVLDEGAQALGRAKRAYERIYAAVRDRRPPDDDREIFEERRAAMQAARYAQDRIALRLGPDSEVHLAFVECVHALDQGRQFARSFERGRIIESSFADQREGHERFAPARQHYIELALREIKDHN
jgi:hypothetical protein